MTNDAATALRNALALSERDRADSAAEVLASLPEPVGGLEVDSPEWVLEMERQARAVTSGETVTEDWGAVEARVPPTSRRRVSVEVRFDPQASAEIEEALAWYAGATLRSWP